MEKVIEKSKAKAAKKLAKKAAKDTFHLKKGDEIVITGGIINGGKGSSNIIKIEVI